MLKLTMGTVVCCLAILHGRRILLFNIVQRPKFTFLGHFLGFTTSQHKYTGTQDIQYENEMVQEQRCRLLRRRIRTSGTCEELSGPGLGNVPRICTSRNETPGTAQEGAIHMH